MKRIIHKLKEKRADANAINMVIIILVVLFMLAFIMAVVPVFIAKSQIDVYAQELAREAEIAGRVDVEVERRLDRLNEIHGLNPTVSWTKTGKIQINTTAEVTISKTVDISFFTFGSQLVEVKANAIATSEVYWK